MKQINCAFVLLVILASVWASEKITPSVQCPGENFDNLHQRITVHPCGKTQCKLVKGTKVKVSFKFPAKDVVNQLTNEVHALIGGIPLPFVGVFGTSACEHITHAEDGTPAPCPLKAGQEYKYVNEFFVEDFYPTTSLTVRWSLNDGKKNVICFEIPAAIVKS